jgi:hypothetical protein
MTRNVRISATRVSFGVTVAAIMGALAGACVPYRIATDYDPEVSFGRLRSYAWIDSTEFTRDAESSPFLERRVRRAVDRALRERGFAAGPEVEADFLVTAFVVDPPRPDPRWRRWAATSCGPVVSVGIGLRYPLGLSFRHPRYPLRAPYLRHPWGYSCAYRIGIGYIWVPVYEQPDDRFPGTLVVDVLDASTRELIWRGWAEGALLERGGRGASQEELDEIVMSVLEAFPPSERDDRR